MTDNPDLRRVTLRLRLAGLLTDFKPEDITDELAHLLALRATAALNAGDMDSAFQLDWQAEDLWGATDRLKERLLNYEPPERDYYAEGYESAADRSMREWKQRP